MSITVTGQEEMYRTLERTAALDKLDPPMQRSVLRLEAFMKVYPPAPAQSRYRRTGTEGRRWTTHTDRSADGLIGRIGNNVPYAPYVQGEQRQTAVHRRTGWHTDEQAVRENEAAIVADFQAAVELAVKGQV